MARCRPPTRITAPTPDSDSRSSLIRRLAISVISRGSRFPDTATVSTGAASSANLSMIGASVPSGNWLRIVRTLASTSCAATAPFFSSANSIVSCDIPSLVVERSCSIPATVLTISSIGLVTPVSISSTLAPRSVVVTVTSGRSTLGNSSTPSRG